MDGQNSLELKSRNFSPFKILLTVFILFMILNLAYIDWLIFFGGKQNIVPRSTPFSPSIRPIVQKAQEENNACPQSCVSQIQEATASYKLTATTPAIIQTETKAQSKVKEFFIPFGSGSSLAVDWQDIEGLQAYIDSANFEGIKKVTFEASVRIPTGNQTAYVRLFNKTDKHPVWFSEVSVTGGTPALLISEPITLDKGNKLYQVQMKTQLQFLTILDQARIHIIIN